MGTLLKFQTTRMRMTLIMRMKVQLMIFLKFLVMRVPGHQTQQLAKLPDLVMTVEMIFKWFQ